MAKEMVSPASAWFRLALTGVVSSALLFSVPVKRLPLLPGAEKLTPAGPTGASRSEVGLVVPITPLVIFSRGSPSRNWMMALSWLTLPKELVSDEVTWLVRYSPSPNGASLTVVVNSRSRWVVG